MSAAAATTSLFVVEESSQVGAARRGANALALAAGLSEVAVGRVGIIATELATNLLHHARDGRLLLRVPAAGELELMAVDSGPGMRNIDQCLRDGHSSAGTAGNGLGAVRRLADSFDIHSQPEVGSVVLARVREAGTPRARPRLGVVCLPMAGEPACGDTWAWHHDGSRASLLVFDGLGHGDAAARAAEIARATFRADPLRAPDEALAQLHQRLQGSRGGAAAIALIDLERRTLRYAGIGNIGAALQAGEKRRGLPSHNGILGSVVGRRQAFDYDWPDGAILVMHSDGLKSRWDFDSAPGVLRRDPALIAGLLYRDFERGRDDLTVAVVGG
jgi:anti-sigma regulatory factor (Ser/Thr protein kinase)